MDVSEVNWNLFLNDAPIYQLDETWMYKNKIHIDWVNLDAEYPISPVRISVNAYSPTAMKL